MKTTEEEDREGEEKVDEGEEKQRGWGAAGGGVISALQHLKLKLCFAPMLS